MNFHYHQYDLPVILPEGDVAIDCEAMGLQQHRDRLCVLQISLGDGVVHVVHFPTPDYQAPKLKAVLQDNKRQKILHFARFDIALIQRYLGVQLANIFCTKIASRLTRTYTDQHGLKDLCAELLNIKLSKQQRSSDWGASSLTAEQISYAAHDVFYLHKIREILKAMLQRDKREHIAKACFTFLPTRAELDLLCWQEQDIFHH